MIKHKAKQSLSVLVLLCAAQAAIGQQRPDAGQILQELRPPLSPPTAGQTLEIQQTSPERLAPGGATVTVTQVDISGNSRFTEAELLGALGDVSGQAYDLAGLYGLTDAISDFYIQAGYPFARAYLPAQNITDGTVHIDVVEGRYGEVRALSDDPDLANALQPYLTTLNSGSLIATGPLERATLLLGDLPGLRITPVVRPGTEAGTGDLLVQVEEARSMSGGISVDNQGNRYSGEFRASGRLALASPFMAGDQLQFTALLSEENLLAGGINYSIPIGASGLRASFSYAHTYYELGKDFAALDATGEAKTSSLGLSYPLLRSQRANFTLSGNYQYKDLYDEYGSLDTRDEKYSHTLPLTLRFDQRDGFAGGGLTFGALTWTLGKLNLEEELRIRDAATTQSHGRFDKLNLDLSRIQRVTAKMTFYASLSAQWAADNLDSSEAFGLGGAQGVRGYPSSESFGDEGWLSQFELRYEMDALSPYVFYDHGGIEVNAKPGLTVEERSEHRGGAGLGLRWRQGGVRLDGVMAWRTSGGAPESDTRDPRPRAWISMSYDF